MPKYKFKQQYNKLFKLDSDSWNFDSNKRVQSSQDQQDANIKSIGWLWHSNLQLFICPIRWQLEYAMLIQWTLFLLRYISGDTTSVRTKWKLNTDTQTHRIRIMFFSLASLPKCHEIISETAGEWRVFWRCNWFPSSRYKHYFLKWYRARRACQRSASRFFTLRCHRWEWWVDVMKDIRTDGRWSLTLWYGY